MQTNAQTSNRRFVCAVIATACLWPTGGSAAAQKKTWLAMPSSSSFESVSPSTLGHNYRFLAKELNKTVGREKDEFETSTIYAEVYDDEIAALKNKVGDRFLFLRNISASDVSYDADKSQISITVSYTLGVDESATPSFRRIDIYQISESSCGGSISFPMDAQAGRDLKANASSYSLGYIGSLLPLDRIKGGGYGLRRQAYGYHFRSDVTDSNIVYTVHTIVLNYEAISLFDMRTGLRVAMARCGPGPSPMAARR